MKIHNIINESQIASEHVKGGLDSYYQLTKAKSLAKADGHDYDKLPEYDRGKDQPHKEKYMALAKEVNEMDQDEVDLGPTWKDDLEAALDRYPESQHDTIKDGMCPECGGNGYMDGDYENEDGEENDECNGMYDYDCDEGEIRDNTWADELKSKEPQAPKQPAPSKEQIMKLLPMLHKEYVQSGRYNAFELGSILKQMYPELNKREAGSYVADFLSNYKPEVESIEEAEKSIEDCIRQTLEKEGGAAGKGAIVDACKEAGYSEEECSDAMSKMSDVKEHEHGDYILEVTEGLYDEGENADTQTNEEEELNNLRKRAGLEVKEVIEDDYEYENDLAMEFVKLPLASMSKEEIRREMSSIFNTLYQMGMGDEPQTDAGVAMEDLGTSVEDSGHYVNDDWTYPSEGEISDEDVQTMIEHQQKVKDVLSQEGDSQYEEAIEEGVYANYVTYVGPNGEELGTEDYDGELEPDMMAQMASDEECKMLCDKHNIDYNDTIGCLKFDDGEATMQDGEELPDGTIAFYGGKDESVEVEEGKLPAGLQAYQDKKNGKKDDDADKDDDKEVDEDKDEVDENAQFESSLAQLKKLSGI